MTTAPSRIDIVTTGDGNLGLSGVIDAHTADQVLAAIRAVPSGGSLVVDVQNVEFVDSSGLRSLVIAHQERSGDGGEFMLAGIGEPLKRLLEITGLDEHFSSR